MTTTRALAVAAYVAAVASPVSADWRSVADLLHAALPAVRGAAVKPADAPAGSTPRWFADWKLGKVYSLDSVVVTFADGVAIRCNLAKAPGKLPRIAAACRTAVAFYRARTGTDTVPAFASIVTASDGSEFDAEACSGLTVDLRRSAIVPRAVRPAVTAEAVAKMERELERRRAGLARAEACVPLTADRHIPLCLSFDGMGALAAERRRIQEQAELAPTWRESVAACESELAAMRAALPDPEPAEAPCDPVAELPIVPAMTAAVAGPKAPLSGNDDAPVPPEPGAPVPAAAVHPVEEMDSADPVEAIDAEPLAALCSVDDEAAVPGPVTVMCLSHRSRDAVLRRVEGRAVPDYGHPAKGGAFRLSLDDARSCAGIKSVRFIGLPRKPYTRAVTPILRVAVAVGAVAPAVGIQGRTPLREILDDVAPRSWIHPIIAGLARPPVVLHAASKL